MEKLNYPEHRYVSGRQRAGKIVTTCFCMAASICAVGWPAPLGADPAPVLNLSFEELNRQLLESSRQAGMAEVATGVLHYVGNVLNSVHISTSLTALAPKETGGALSASSEGPGRGATFTLQLPVANS